MKIIVSTALIIGALFLSASKDMRQKAVTALATLASGVERAVMRGDYAEIRLVDQDGFDAAIQESGRVVIVVIQKELSTSSRNETLELDHAMKELPGEVLIAKVIAERNPELMAQLQVTQVPYIHVYRDGVLLERFDSTVDAEEFTNFILARLKDKPTEIKSSSGAPDIRPMRKDWLPPGVEEKK